MWWIAPATPARIPAAPPSDAVEPRVVDHLDDRAARRGPPRRPSAPRRLELDLAGRVRAVAELVLEPLDVDRVALAVGREARQEEAGDAALGLREHEERVAHRRRAEPLVAGDLVLGAGAAAVERPRRRGVGAHVGAALLLGHRHAAERARFLSASGDACAPSYSRDVRRGSHSAAISGCLRSAGIDRVGHRDRAADAGLDLAEQHEAAPRGRRARPAAARATAARAGRARRRARISSCHAGWNSTSSIRLPKRSWVRSFGGFSFATAPARITAGRPQIAPSSRARSSAQSPPSRRAPRRGPGRTRRRCGPRAAAPGW